MKNKGLKLLIITFIFSLILTPSLMQAGGLHFGIIKAIEGKIEELKEKKRKRETTWIKRFWFDYDSQLENDSGGSVQQTSDGGYIIVGDTSFESSYYQVFLLKTDKYGKEEWRKTFSDGTWGYSVQQTVDGGYIVAGVAGTAEFDAYLLKTDKYGNKKWSKRFDGEYGNEEARSVQQTSDGGYIIVGFTGEMPRFPEDVYIIKTDSNGNEEWSKTISSEGDEGGYSIRQTSDGGYIIAAYNSEIAEGIRLIKIDSNGNEEWSKYFGGSLPTELHGYGPPNVASVQQTLDGGYILIGSGRDESYNVDIYLIKTDPIGKEEWCRTFDFKGDEVSSSIQQTEDGGYVIFGETGYGHLGDFDIFLLKTDSYGNEEWRRYFISEYTAFIGSGQQTVDGGYIITGEIWFPTPRGTCNDVFLIKTDAYGNVE
jgi:photosystem II stability/assembly factor-like uncharacterized protein